MPVRSLPAVALIALALLAGCPAEEQECSSGQTRCYGNCVDAQTDARACGSTCTICPSGASCVAGVCGCPPGQTACGGACVDTATSDAHCGGCDQPCGLGTCTGGACACSVGATDCGAWPACVDPATDTAHCGGCNAPCRPGEECTDPDVNGLGTCSCLPGFSDCTSACFDLQNDELHCGGCTASVCPSGATCVTATCTCPPGAPDVCGGAPGRCVNQDTDPTACGPSCSVCSAGADCGLGTCCPPAFPTWCGPGAGACANVATDESHCGDCATACAGGQVCTTGKCCAPGQLVCGSTVKSCCTGGCCGDACQTAHANGLGQSFYDCSPLGTLTLSAATAAADAWGAGVTYALFFAGNCLGRQTPSACAVWCYDGALAGKVHLNTISVACVSPSGADPGWN